MRRQLIGLIAVTAIAAAPALAQEAGSFSELNTIERPYDISVDEGSGLRTHGGGGIEVYTDRLTFLDNCPGPDSPLLDFETGLIGPGAVSACTNPNSWTTGSDPCLNPMDPQGNNESLDILSVGGASGGDPTAELVMLGPGFLGSPSYIFGPNFFVDDLRLEPTCGEMTCIGFDLCLPLGAPGAPDILVFDTVGAVLGTASVFATSGCAFFGVVAPEPIGAIQIVTPAAVGLGGELIDNLQFQECGGSDLDEIVAGLEMIEAKLDANLDVALSTRASQTSVDAIEAKLDNLDDCEIVDVIRLLLPNQPEYDCDHPCQPFPSPGECGLWNWQDDSAAGDVAEFCGVTISGDSPVLVFDDGNPTCGDDDLAGGDGNILILDAGGACAPDDNEAGGTMVFDFDEPTNITYVTIRDSEEGGQVRAYDCGGGLLAVGAILTLGDGVDQQVFINVTGACRIEVQLNGSGAVVDMNCLP
ncbi:MAG: hypothetical protein AAF533_08105 [Acidobacteriota bacterium]